MLAAGKPAENLFLEMQPSDTSLRGCTKIHLSSTSLECSQKFWLRRMKFNLQGFCMLCKLEIFSFFNPIVGACSLVPYVDLTISR